MSALPYNLSLHRRLYTGESVQQAHRAIDALSTGESPIPAADSTAQQHLEARLLLALIEFRSVYTRYPLGIAAVHPDPDGIALTVESEERATEILFSILPAYMPGEEVHGVPGLRITRRDRTAIELHVLGQPTRLRLAGLPARVWRVAEENTLAKWIDPGRMNLSWRSSPRSWTEAEREHHAQWEDPGDHYVQVTLRGSWLSSGLLRRAALLHTVADTFLVDGYRGSAFDVARLVLRCSHVPGKGPGPYNIVAALLDPLCGLPLHITRFSGDTAEGCSGDQRFVLEDDAKTVVLDIRAAVDPPPSRLSPDLWQSILRRLPRAGFTPSPPRGALAGLLLRGSL
ncbi:hypothetical protein ACIOUE_38990 [Streptomyces xanthochromogenes]|uniref:hypothetical protein n=1 Tax=Streptomyces xanthochromogenes TaxID=67384 RepID=UPI0037F387DE